MKNSGGDVSLTVVRRLQRYYRFLTGLKASGAIRISSKEIAKQMGLTASQIRQDLNYFGGFGQQGYGYNVDQLAEEIARILYANDVTPAILLGVGNLGRALVNYLQYEVKSVPLIGLFDKNPKTVAEVDPTLSVLSITALEEFCKQNHPEIAILCIPSESAQIMAERLARYGIRGIWNFTHVELKLDSSVKIENMHLGGSLMTLKYMVHNSKGRNSNSEFGSEE